MFIFIFSESILDNFKTVRGVLTARLLEIDNLFFFIHFILYPCIIHKINGGCSIAPKIPLTLTLSHKGRGE
jgi:hypothetical protein